MNNFGFQKIILILATVLGMFVSCTSTKTAQKFNGLDTPHGKANTYQSTTNIGINLLIVVHELVPKANLEHTVEDFTTAAKKDKANTHLIVDTSCNPWWFIFPPISLVITPVSCTVTGYTYK